MGARSEPAPDEYDVLGKDTPLTSNRVKQMAGSQLQLFGFPFLLGSPTYTQDVRPLHLT